MDEMIKLVMIPARFEMSTLSVPTYKVGGFKLRNIRLSEDKKNICLAFETDGSSCNDVPIGVFREDEVLPEESRRYLGHVFFVDESKKVVHGYLYFCVTRLLPIEDTKF